MLTLLIMFMLFVGINNLVRHGEKKAEMRQEIIDLYKSGASEQEVMAKALEYKYGSMK